MRLAALAVLGLMLSLPGCFSQCYVGGGVVTWRQPDAWRETARLEEEGPPDLLVRRPDPDPGLSVAMPAALVDRFGPRAVVQTIGRDHGDAGLMVAWDAYGRAAMNEAGPAVDARRGAKALLLTLGADPAAVDTWAERNAGRLGGEAIPGDPAIPIDIPIDVEGALEEVAAVGEVLPTVGTQIRIRSGADTWWVGIYTTVLELHPVGFISVAANEHVTIQVLDEPRGEAEAARAGAERAALFGWNATTQEDARFHPSVICSD